MYTTEHQWSEKIFTRSKELYPFLRRREDSQEVKKCFETAHILSHYTDISIFDIYSGSH